MIMKHNILKIFSLLAAVMISSSVKILGVSFRIDGIEYSTLSDNTVEVDGFQDKGIVNVIIPETVEYEGREYTVTAVGDYAFQDNYALQTISLPSSILSIGYSAFSGCYLLADIGSLNNVKTIEGYAFANTSVTDINIQSDVETIGSYAFGGCHLLSKVYIKSVKQLDSKVFSGCSLLEAVEGSFGSIGNEAFRECSLLSQLILSDGTEAIGENAFSYCVSLSQVDFPESVETIGKDAFSYCVSLSQIDLNGVKSIEENAFKNCISLAEINWPDNLETIGDYAFYNCVSLLEINLPNSVKDVGQYSFYGCGPLSIVLSENIETIGDYAFYGCQISEITFPECISDIGKYAFGNCFELRTINIKNPTPPSSSSTGFDNHIGEIAVLNVPVGAAELYKRYWSNFETINEVNF